MPVAIGIVLGALAFTAGNAGVQRLGARRRRGSSAPRGALLVMLVDEMVPEAQHKAGILAGPATVLGFALAAGLSKLT